MLPRAALCAALAALCLRTRAAHADPPAPSPPHEPTIAELDARLRAHDEEIARLRRELDEHRAEARVELLPVLRFSGFVQTDWVIHNQLSQDQLDPSTEKPLNQDRFLLRRGHLRADAERGILSASLEIDANTVNGAQVRPIDAEGSIRWPARPREGEPYVAGSAGLMRIPFGFEVQELDNVRPFLERATVMRAMFPGEFDLGARFRAGYRALSLAVAVMNGHPIGELQFPDVAPNASKDLVFRLGVDTKLAPGWRFEAGFSGDNGEGFHSGTPATKDTLVWRDANQDGLVQPTEIQVIPGTAGTASQNFHRFALGGDARLHVAVPRVGELTLRAEIAWGTNLDRGIEPADPVGAARDLRELGWSLGFSQEVTRYAFFGVRYDRYDPDLDARDQKAIEVVPVDRTYSTLALMAGARYLTGRLIFEYDHNTNPLGLSVSGQPTTLKADASTLRAEVSF